MWLRAASELEDENRELREKLRFNSNEYEFRAPFWYHKANAQQPQWASLVRELATLIASVWSAITVSKFVTRMRAHLT